MARHNLRMPQRFHTVNGRHAGPVRPGKASACGPARSSYRSAITGATPAAGVLAVVTNEPRKAFAHLGCFRMQTLQARNDVPHFTGAQILGDLMHPTIR